MRKIILATVAAIGLVVATPALAGQPRHTWYELDFRSATCGPSGSPAELTSAKGVFVAHSMGASINPISPSDVEKDDKGNIHVTVHGTRDGNAARWQFFTSRAACDAYVTKNGVVPDQANSGDIN